MSSYNCKGCNYKTKRSADIYRHLGDRVNPCFEFGNIPIEERFIHIKKGPNIKCKKCEKEFCNSSSRCRHEKTCNKTPIKQDTMQLTEEMKKYLTLLVENKIEEIIHLLNNP